MDYDCYLWQYNDIIEQYKEFSETLIARRAASKAQKQNRWSEILLPSVGSAVFIRKILHNIRQGTIQQFAKRLQRICGHGFSGLHSANGRTADAAFDLQCIGGCTTTLHRFP